MEKKLNREIGIQLSGLCVRETEDGARSRVIEGHAAVFGVRSVNLTPWSTTREVYEIMEPGCIDTDLLNRSDVVLTAFHDNTAILGRWRQGTGTLGLELDERGLKMRCELADTERANELLSAIERGDISGMSFAFTADEEDTENGVSYERVAERNGAGKEVWLRHVKRVTGLYDVTIAGHPAYPQTDVAQREIDAWLDEQMGTVGSDGSDESREREQREAEERERAEREAREQAEKQAREMAAQVRRFRRRRIEEIKY